MADEEGPQAPATQGAYDPSALQDPPPFHIPQVPLIPNAPQAPPALEALHLPAPHMPLLNGSHFKLKYSRKPDKDTEAHLLRTNDWIDTDGFQYHVKVQRFCLTLTGEARLWYGSLRLINIDWLGLQISLGNNTPR